MDSLVAGFDMLPMVAKLTLVFVFSSVVGSFLNVVIYRLPIIMERDWKAQAREILSLPAESTESFTLLLPQSRCPKCQHKLGIWENIPLISYIFLRGKCRACLATISVVYPLVELLTAVLATIVFWHFDMGLHAVFAVFFVYMLVVLSGIDIKTYLLPDVLTLSLLWAGVVISFFGYFISLDRAVLGVVVGYLILWLVATLFKLLLKKEGMGLGDAKLLAAIFAWVDIINLPLVLGVASITALVVTVILRLINHAKIMDNPLPFGPYLALGGFVAFLYGDALSSILY